MENPWNTEITFILTWSSNQFKIGGPVNNQLPTFELTGTSIYVSVVTLSTQDNAALLQQLKSGFKITINWNK